MLVLSVFFVFLVLFVLVTFASQFTSIQEGGDRRKHITVGMRVGCTSGEQLS